MEMKRLSSMLGMLFLSACALPVPPPAQDKVETAKPETKIEQAALEAKETPTTPAEPTLGITADQYVERLREVAATMGSLKVGDVATNSDDASTTVRLADGATVSLSVDKGSQQVSLLTFTGDPSQGSDGLQLITLAGISVHAAFKASEQEQLKTVLGEIFTGLEIGGKMRSARIGDRIVFAALVVNTGLVVGVEPADA